MDRDDANVAIEVEVLCIECSDTVCTRPANSCVQVKDYSMLSQPSTPAESRRVTVGYLRVPELSADRANRKDLVPRLQQSGSDDLPARLSLCATKHGALSSPALS
ncbi:hypothetical protein IG631_24094 [Alternaria alternata]|nr:hypothetical protein IG631_24094 [Alternaria alternata]